MASLKTGSHASAAWLATLSKILAEGKDVSPRGMRTLELQHHTVQVQMQYPVVLCPARKLSYTFLAAEAVWILSGDDKVETIAPYNPNIGQFSDDGVRFYGAYGPRIIEQFDWCLGKLWEDRDTRQAVMTIWRQRPPKTKDVPCTVAVAFSIRNSRLHCHVFMRSSDAWLGLPYDVFNFSMLALKMTCFYNEQVHNSGMLRDPIELGWLHLTAASSHLYEKNFVGAEQCLEAGVAPIGEVVPAEPLLRGRWYDFFQQALVTCRDKAEGMPLMWRIRP